MFYKPVWYSSETIIAIHAIFIRSFFSKFTDSRSETYNQMILFTGIFQRFANIFNNYFVTGRLEEPHRSTFYLRNNKLK